MHRDRRHLLPLALLLLALPKAVDAQICEFTGQLPQRVLSGVNWGAANIPAQNCSDGIRTRVYNPNAGGVWYDLSPAGCNPQTSSCTVVAHVGMSTPGNSANNQSFDSIVKVFWFNSGGTNVGTCGFPGATLSWDQFDTTIQIGGFTCGGTLTNPLAGTYRVEVRHSKCNSSSTYFADSQTIELTQPFFEEQFCQPWKVPAETSCQACAGGGGGGDLASVLAGSQGATCSLDSGGGGPAAEPPFQPNATLRYKGSGAGATGQPFASAWRAAHGRGWSHEFAERIFEDPDESNVVLVTARGTLRRFTALDPGSGLRRYQSVQPSDEYRALYFDTATSGWQFHGLDGSVATFSANGLWSSTRDRNGKQWAALSYSGSLVTEVQLPDGQRDAFTYVGGRLKKLVRKGTNLTTTRTWTYTYSGPDLTRIDYPDGRAVTMDYDNRFGLLTRMTLVADNDGNAATPALGSTRVLRGWGYDSSGNAYRSWSGANNFTDAAARDKWSLAFDDPADPTTTTVTDPLGGVSTIVFEPDPSGSGKKRVISKSGGCPTCGSGPNVQYEYTDSSNPMRPTRSIDGRGVWTDFFYDSRGRLTMRIDAANDPFTEPDLPRTTEWSYNPTFPGFADTVTGPYAGASGSRVTIRTYDPLTGDLTSQRITGVEATYPTGSFDLETVTTFNTAGLPLTVDPPGHGTADVTSFVYAVPNTNGTIPSSRTDPEVGTTSFGYDVYNRRTSVTDANAVQTVTAYDALNRVTSVTRKAATAANDLVTTYTYNAFGDLFCVKLPAGNAIQYVYDAAGRRTEERRGLAVTTPTATSCLSISATNFAERRLWTLDNAGHRTNEKLQRGTADATWTTQGETSWVYSSLCHLDRTIQAPGQSYAATTEYTYDCNGNLEKVWDPLHPRASFPDDPSTLYAYDALNRLKSTTQPWGGAGGGTVTTSYLYDAQDHLIGVTDGEGTTTSYLYSDRDLMTSQLSEVTGSTTYDYDESGDLAEETDARGVTVIRTTDAAGRVTLVDYPGTALDTSYVYGTDPLTFSRGRLLSITRGTDVVTYTWDRFGRMLTDGPLTYTYDKNSNRTSVTYPGSLKATYTFDRMDRENSLTMQEGANPVVTLVNSGAAYKAYGPLTSLTHPTTTARTVTRNFNLSYAPTSIVVSGNLLTWNYTVDLVGNPTAISQTQPAAVSRTYGYQDWQYYLTSGAGPWSGPLSWTYDKIGNRLTETRGALTDDYDYLPNTGATGNTAVLDLVNLGVGGTRDYTFDAGGYLDLVDAGANQVDFAFDEAGQLGEVERAVAGEQLTHRYDGRNYLCESTDLVTGGYVRPTYSSAGVVMSLERLPTSVGTAERHNYLYFAGQPIALWKKVGAAAAIRQFLTTDHLGAPALVFNTAGTSTWLGGLEPFGRDWQEGTGNDMLGKGIQVRLPGQWGDALYNGTMVGLSGYYNVHRWYAPLRGTYDSADPKGVRAGPNLFAYSWQSPLRFSDPLGLDSAGCTVSPEQRESVRSMIGGEIPWESACMLQCCAYHDACYDKFGCDAHSWLAPQRSCNPSLCNSCNETIVRCAMSCMNSMFAPPEDGPLYYCAVQHKFVEIPKDFPDLPTAQDVCDTGDQERCCDPVE